MAAWLNRLNISKQNLLPAALASLLATGACVTTWYPNENLDAEMSRFGTSLARSVAHMSAGHLVHKDRIELAVLANELLLENEVAGVAFYDANDDIIAMSGTNEMISQYTAPATLDDTFTGYVSIVLNKEAFAPPSNLSRWLWTLLILVSAPFLTLIGIRLANRGGSQSLPIVTVPETPESPPQTSFGIYINLHNQLALSKSDLKNALNDAMTMAQEVCAIHHGIPIPLGSQGALILFDRTSVDAEQAICGSALVQTLLSEFDTQGHFRCYLDTVACPKGPHELDADELDTLKHGLNSDTAFTRAAISKASTILISSSVYQEMKNSTWVSSFSHPILEDEEHLYLVEDLPEAMASLVAKQSELILGFAA